ncbi:hypothetical protein C1645_204301 [Glomus cerebriforme]|uniref:Uncharacterized protein n=1 Tax=Glomus cerebriforme TaxID=658196 RepID=A0A397SXA9_9GLOM|nr:hypothetical protein C1645_204301 [Glomus cerebriforme]
MEQNNNDVAEQKINLEYTNLVETMDVKTQKDITGQQSLAELGSHVQHNNTIPEHQSKQSSVRDIIGPPCQSQIQFASSSTSNQGNHEDDATSQNLKVQQSVTQTQCAADNIDIKVEPVIDSVKNIAIESQTGNNSLKSSTLQSVPSSSQANSAVEQSNESNESILNLSNSQVTTATMPKISVTQENETTKSPHIQTISKSTPKSNVTVYTKDSNDYTKLADRSKSMF